jgi:serine/threonine-protein kinase
MTELPADLATALRDRYALERELGRGGMATVYLAKDLKHERQIALKVLHPDLAGALGPERFLREIATVAGLHHPHIIPLYDSGKAGGYLYQVMPLAEGETLRDRLRRETQLPLEDALQIAAEVADALSYAHRRGIVHRDIKPGNILLESGHAVVADFGIARAITAAGGDRLTATGIAIGTAEYMSPEQVTGSHDLDGRSDLYSLGCVLYEMLAGEPPFTGTTQAHIIHQQMVATPRPLSEIRPSVPADVVSVLDRMLAKQSADRWRDAETLRSTLDELRRANATAAANPKTPVAARGQRGRRRTWLAFPLVAGLAVAAYLATPLVRRSPPEIRIGRRTQVTMSPGLEFHAALSPNGDLLAYAAGMDSRVYVRQVDGGQPITVARDLPGLQGWPFWSPDGRQLTFSSQRGLEIVPALGGVPRLLAPGPANGVLLLGGPWSPNGREVLFSRGDTLYAVPVTGDAARAVAVAPGLHSCSWAPTGNQLACVSGNFEAMSPGPWFGNLAASAILIIPSTGGQASQLVDDGYSNASPVWMQDGTLLFVSNREGGRDIYAVRVDANGRATNPSHRITTGLNALSINIAADGSRLAYAAFAEHSNIYTLEAASDRLLSIANARPVTTGNQIIEWFDISSDGSTLVFDSDRSGHIDLYRIALDRSAEPEALTNDSMVQFYPAFSPNGQELAFHSIQNNRRQLFVMPAGGGPARAVGQTEDDDRTATWTPDGQGLVALTNWRGPNEETRLFRRTRAGEWEPPRRWRKPACYPEWSPDSSVAACATLTGQLLLTNLQGDSLALLGASGLIPGMGQFPQWSSDGKWVYYLGVDSISTSIYAAPVASGNPRIVLRFDDPTRPWHRYGFQVFRDRFYFTLGDRQSHIWVGEIPAPNAEAGR